MEKESDFQKSDYNKKKEFGILLEYDIILT